MSCTALIRFKRESASSNEISLLAQTLFTNVYLHNPYLIEDVALKAFSIGILRIIDMIRDIVNKAVAYEE